ncbi:MAG: SEC-C metal-binding domain-containing protein [Spirochaetia bacterium]|nr:SEC-C metal-binding domain-containing protein [Spirochaetia bacterium]
MKKAGRNDPCPCDSGKKYKHCCLGKQCKILPFSTESEPHDTGSSFGVADLTFRVNPGQTNLASEFIQQIQNNVGERLFSSEEELKAFISTTMKTDSRLL